MNEIKRTFKFEQNAVVKDKITGYVGVILGRTEYATGCVQYGVVNRDYYQMVSFQIGIGLMNHGLKLLKKTLLLD